MTKRAFDKVAAGLREIIGASQSRSSCFGCYFNGAGVNCNRFTPPHLIDEETDTGLCGPNRSLFHSENEFGSDNRDHGNVAA